MAACETGHRAEIWTKPDLGFINIYLDGFEIGQGKVAVLMKADNPHLTKMIANRVALFAEIVKESPTRFQIVLKELSSQEVWQLVAEARQFSESSEFISRLAERHAQELTVQKLLAPYRPTTLEISCDIRSPSPVRFALNESLNFRPQTVEHFAATHCDYLLFKSTSDGKVGYIKAPADVKKRLLRAHFSGYELRAQVVGVSDEVCSHSLASIWEEYEAAVLIYITKAAS